MGKSDRQPSPTGPPVVIHTNDDRGRQDATDVLLTTDHDLMALVPSEGHDDAALDRLIQLLRAQPDAALAVAANRYGDTSRLATTPGGGQAPGPVGLTGSLVRRLRTVGANTGPGPMVVVRVEPVLAVGGFDPVSPGLGLADLVERLRRAGHGVLGVPDQLPWVEGLHRGLSVADHCRSIGLWLNRYRADQRSRGPADYRRALLVAVPMARRAGPMAPESDASTEPSGSTSNENFAAELDRIVDDARSWWAGPPPHEDQDGIGFRADWRFLLPDGPRRSTRIILADGDRRADPDSWRWLVEDGWTERIALGSSTPSDGQSEPAPSAPEPPEPAPPEPEQSGPEPSGPGDDVVFIGLGVDPAPALDHCGPDCAVIIEVNRSPVTRSRHHRLLSDAGFGRIDTYLVTPDLRQAKRYVPLQSGDGLGWLLASPPPLPELGRSTEDNRPSAGRTLRRRLRTSAIDTAIGAIRTVGDTAGRPLGGAFGQGLLVAARGTVADGQLLQPEPFALITSGHDEGSRAVLTPIGTSGPDGHNGAGRATVMKVASRPRYNTNIEAEVARITALRTRLGTDPLLPDIEPPQTVGALLASREVYAGRWTASDLCYRVPDTAEHVLSQVLRTIDRFTDATITPGPTATWNADTFEQLLGRLFDRYDHHLGEDRARDRLRRLLAERAEAITGSPLPMAQRHYDLGPWNVLFGDDRRITIIDWEVGPPRQADEPGPAGADQLYFAKYWIHIAMGTRSVDEELRAFTHLADRTAPDDPRAVANREVTRSLAGLGVPPASTPLITVHVWLESALHTIARRSVRGVEPGSPGRYVDTLARHADLLLDATADQL